ncbi:MAG: MinD/ParA family protein [Phycisphaeraceae bacterium]
METAVPRRAKVVAVTSGKGGVGKSNIAVNLAIRLSTMGRKVILLDADLGTANADVLCNVTPGGTLAHVVSGRMSLAQVMLDAPGGFRLVAGASGLAQMAALSEFERARLVRQMQEIEDQADMILIDTGAGVSPNVMSFVIAADQQLVVTTPEPTAVADAYAMIKTIVRQCEHPDIRVLVNMARDQSEAKAVFERIEAVSEKFLSHQPRFAGHVTLDARVPMAVRRRRPFVLDQPNSDASRCINQLAHRMDRHAADPRNAIGLIRRMTMWLAG